MWGQGTAGLGEKVRLHGLGEESEGEKPWNVRLQQVSTGDLTAVLSPERLCSPMLLKARPPQMRCRRELAPEKPCTWEADPSRPTPRPKVEVAKKQPTSHPRTPKALGTGWTRHLCR